MDNVNFPPPPLMVRTPEKRNMNKFCDYHQDRGHNTNESYHLKKQIEEAVDSRRLAHLVKDIRQGGQKSKGSAKGKEKVINMVRSQGYRKRPYEKVKHWMDNAITFPSVPRYQLMNCPVVVVVMIEGFRVRRIHVDGDSSSEVMYEHCFRNLSYRTRSRLRESRIPLVGFSGEVSYPIGVIDLEVTMGECGKTRTVIMEFAVVKSPSPYNALLGRTGMRSLGAVASIIHSMMKFPTSNGIATISTTRENLRECRQIGEAQDLNSPRRQRKEPMQLDDMEERRQVDKKRKPPKSGAEEKIVKIDIFAWTPADMTGIPRAITEHTLDTYHHIEPKVQKKRSLAPDRRKVVTDEVNEWLKAGIMRKKDEEKTTFHTEEGVFCYTKMPFGLKNAGATYQRLVDSAFKEQIGVNLEAYVNDMVIKSRTEQDIIKDIEQTFSTLRRINMKLNPKKCSFGMEEGKFLGYIVTSKGIRANPKKAKAVMDMPSPKTLKQMQSLSGKLAALNRFLSKSAERSLPFLDTLKKCTNKKDFRWTEATEIAFLEIKKLVSELPTLTTQRKPGAETNYALMDKLALALVHAARRLRRYFQAYPIKVITNNPIGQVLNNSGAPGRLAKWAVELGAYGITYVPRVVVKDQRLYTDGASNNEGSGAGLILIAPDDVEYSYALRLNFYNSNNDAEYEALLAGLRIAKEMQVRDIHAFVDSKLVASQVEGSYEAKGKRMIKYREKVLELASAFNRFRITHILRAENRKADALSKLAAVQFDHLSKEVLVEVLNKCSVEAQEVNMVVEEEGPTWMTLIQNYLEKGKLPEDPVDARTLMEKIGNYTMEAGALYRESYLVPLMKCVGPLHANYIIREVHMGSCGMHDGPRQVVAKAMNLGYYWPFMHKDAREMIRACDDCQAHASVPRLPKADMVSVTSACPFMKWGMDIVGPLSEGPGRVRYLIVATDYFTKWMEAKPLATITGKHAVNFTWDNIVCRFRILATIITDNETQFGNRAVERANRSLLRGIKTRLKKGGSAWAEEVPNVLWAHRTMKKTSNGETPFNLTYGTEAVIPAEIGLPTHRTSNVNEKTNDQELHLNLDLLDERREIAAIRGARYKQQAEKYCNKKVRHVQFKVGEFVLRRNEVSRAANTGKLGPTWEGPYKVIQAFQS
ncbi:reverse transcriptase domain-containing protein [Tanacetum coccineum]